MTTERSTIDDFVNAPKKCLQVPSGDSVWRGHQRSPISKNILRGGIGGKLVVRQHLPILSR
jgi:hypothetical protein